MKEYITLGQSFIISGFSMLIVFTGLLIISFIISMLKVLDKENKKKDVKIIEDIDFEEVIPDEATIDEEELVAAIAAAIASSMGVGVNDIVIKNIKRTNNMDNWTQAALSEQMLSDLYIGG